MMETEALITALQARGWTIQRTTDSSPLLPPDVLKRYPRLPDELVSFLKGMDFCTNSEESIWFLCRAEFRRTEPSGFRWNEHELMALEAVQGDVQRQAEIHSFWDRHFPFMFAVHSDYDYLAVRLDEEAWGQIVHGYAPCFEETDPVASSFREFVVLLTETALGTEQYPLTYFV